MTIRRGVIGVVVVLSVLVLNGCVVFKTAPVAAQSGLIGHQVTITVTGCASQSGGSPPAGSCSSTGKSGSTAASGPSQVWLAFRVPTRTVPPPSFSSSATGPSDTGPQLNFTRSASYESELQRLQPATAGEKWIGYVSQYVSYNNVSGDQNFTASIEFLLQPGDEVGEAAPYAGPFTYQAVIGGRQHNSATPDPGEPVTCGTSLTTQQQPNPDEGWVCADDSYPATLGSDATLATRDAAVTPGTRVTALAGSTVKLPFTFSYAGPAAGTSFTLTAAVAGPGVAIFMIPTIPGGTVTTNPTAISPSGTGDTPVTVSVTIPKNTRRGTYPLSLVAHLPDGELRSAITTFVVSASCRVPKLRGKRLHKARRLLKHARCALGKKRGQGKRVRSQKPAAGKLVVAGSKISVKLGH